MSSPVPREFPCSRWWLLPWLPAATERLALARVRPTHVTWTGLACGLLGAVLIAGDRSLHGLAAAAVLAAWCCDRLDGALARRTRTATSAGGRFDANVDEFLDLLWHAAAAWTLVRSGIEPAAVWLFAAFVSGKYLFFQALPPDGSPAAHPPPRPGARSWPRFLHHAPGNADVRLHLLAIALFGSVFYDQALRLELCCIAIYYPYRWVVSATKLIRQATLTGPRRGGAV